MAEALWAEKPKPVWVPRGYYSKSKIKEDDIQMLITEEMDAWLEKLKAQWDEDHEWYESTKKVVENLATENIHLKEKAEKYDKLLKTDNKVIYDLRHKLEAVKELHDEFRNIPTYSRMRVKLRKILEAEGLNQTHQKVNGNE